MPSASISPAVFTTTVTFPPAAVATYLLPVIGHSLWTLILACIGGLAAGWIQARGRASKDGQAP
jgi:hypothetical protein